MWAEVELYMDLNLAISQVSATHFDVKHPSNSNANFVRFVVYISLKYTQVGQCQQWAGKELYIIKQGSQVSWWSFTSLIMWIDLKFGIGGEKAVLGCWSYGDHRNIEKVLLAILCLLTRLLWALSHGSKSHGCWTLELPFCPIETQ